MWLKTGYNGLKSIANKKIKLSSIIIWSISSHYVKEYIVNSLSYTDEYPVKHWGLVIHTCQWTM